MVIHPQSQHPLPQLLLGSLELRLGAFACPKRKMYRDYKSQLPSLHAQAQWAYGLQALVGLEAEKTGWLGARLQRNPWEQNRTIAFVS